MEEAHEIFSRSISVWGEKKQAILAKSTILIAGMGGLGCIVSQILVRAGIGRLLLLDNKDIDRSDLNRQALYSLDDLGRSKVEIAAQKLSSFTASTEIIPLHLTIEQNQFPHILSQYSFDGIADCLDNYQSRFILETLLSNECFMVHGGVQDDYGQVTTIVKHRTLFLKDIYYGVKEPALPIAVCPQIVFCLGSLMAYEVQKNLWGNPELINSLLIIELSDFSFSKVLLTPFTERKEQ